MPVRYQNGGGCRRAVAIDGGGYDGYVAIDGGSSIWIHPWREVNVIVANRLAEPSPDGDEDKHTHILPSNCKKYK